MTIYPDLLARRADLSPDREAMAELATGRRVTYGALHERVGRVTALLRQLGVAEGHRVGILCRNRIAFFELLFACARAGAILVPLNWRMPRAELQGILDDCTPTAVFAGTEDISKLDNADMPIIDLDEAGDRGYEARLEVAPVTTGRAFWPAEDVWYLLYTSGTTGRPKAVIQTPQMAVTNYINVQTAIDLTSNDRTLNFLPLFHTAGINLYTLPALLAGGHVSIMPGFDVDQLVNLVTADKLDVFFGVPAVYRQLEDHSAFDDIRLSGVRNWGCGGAPLPDRVVQAYAERGALVCNGYGMTETGPTAFLMDAAHVTRKIGSVGHIQLMTEARLVDSEGAMVPLGETGEVQFRGPAVTPGYWNNPVATEATFTADGWLKTGDLARKDADGYAYVVGRSKEMFISGGENVYPAEVENCYMHHPGIVEIAVIGEPDTRWGEVGHAFILCKDETLLNEADLIQFGRDHLAPFKVPKHFTFVDDFPRTAAGKIQKHLLPKEKRP